MTTESTVAVYIGLQNDSNRTVSKSLEEKGINLLKVAPSGFHIDTVILQTQEGYGDYVVNLAAFMRATETGERLRIEGQGFYPIGKVPNLLPVKYPPICCAFRKSGQDEELLTYGARLIDIKGQKRYILSNYTITQVVNMGNMTGIIKDVQVPIDSINLESFASLQLIVKVFSRFLQTHTYTAFTSKEHANVVRDLTEKVDRDPVANEEKETDGSGMSSVGDRLHVPNRSILGQLPEGFVRLTYAKPSTGRSYGELDQIPASTGITFPYDEDLTHPDKDTVPTCLSTYFLKCLGSTPEKALETMVRIRKDWINAISDTSTGYALSHMAKMIITALRVQGRPFLIFEDETYLGTILQGNQFTISARGNVHEPYSYEETVDAIRKSSTHYQALISIESVIGVTPKSIRHIRSVITVQRDVLTMEDIDKLKVNAKLLRFPEPYWTVNTDTIMKLTALLEGGKSDIDITVPMHHSALLTEDWYEEVLSAFGFQAPTFDLPGCKMHSLKSSETPRLLAVRLVDLTIAVADWKRIRMTKKIHNMPTSLSAKYSDRFIPKKQVSDVYACLVSFAKCEEEPSVKKVCVEESEDVDVFQLE